MQVRMLAKTTLLKIILRTDLIKGTIPIIRETIWIKSREGLKKFQINGFKTKYFLKSMNLSRRLRFL
jgi:hypothetical protein